MSSSVILDSASKWSLWFSELQSIAALDGIWPYLDPHLDEGVQIQEFLGATLDGYVFDPELTGTWELQLRKTRLSLINDERLRLRGWSFAKSPITDKYGPQGTRFTAQKLSYFVGIPRTPFFFVLVVCTHLAGSVEVSSAELSPGQIAGIAFGLIALAGDTYFLIKKFGGKKGGLVLWFVSEMYMMYSFFLASMILNHKKKALLKFAIRVPR